MKNVKYLFLVLATISAIFVNSCTKDSTTGPQPTPVKNYVPNTLGNYWIYQKTRLDTNNQVLQDSVTIIDSSVVVGSLIKYGKELTQLTDYDISKGTPQKNLDLYMYSENNKIYIASNLINSMIGFDQLPFQLPFTLPDTLLMFADANGSTWTVFTMHLSNITVPVPSIGDVTIDGNITITGSFIGSENLTVGTQTLATDKFTDVFGFNGTITGTISGFPVTFPVTIDRKLTLWFGDKTGLLKYSLDPFKFSLPFMTPIQLEGWIENTIRYKVQL